MIPCYGRRCKLHWDYDKSLERIVRNKETPEDVISEIKPQWTYSKQNLAQQPVSDFPSISLYLKPECKRYIDAEILFYDNECHCLKAYFIREKKKCKKNLNSTSVSSHYISEIYYGTELWIKIPKIGFPKNWNKVRELLKSRNFTEEQKRAQCHLLINPGTLESTSKPMTLGEILGFMKSTENDNTGNHIPIFLKVSEMNRKALRTIIRNHAQFKTFISRIYYTYRKVELRLKELNHPSVFPDPNFEGRPLDIICQELNAVKEDFWMADTTEFLQMYPMLKKMFFYYIAYIKSSIMNETEITEGSNIRSFYSNQLSDFRKINNWTLMKIKEDWVESTGPFIVTPPGFKRVIEQLRETTKFKDASVVEGNTSEPYVGNNKCNQIFFGFADMERARGSKDFEHLNCFEYECPDECTGDLRKWICTKCGELVRTTSDRGKKFLVCSCGTKEYSVRLLVCANTRNHDSNDNYRPPRQQGLYSEFNESLEIILTQLQKIQLRKGDRADPKINTAINCISMRRSKEEIRESLRKVRDVVSNGDAEHLINEYLDIK